MDANTMDSENSNLSTLLSVPLSLVNCSSFLNDSNNTTECYSSGNSTDSTMACMPFDVDFVHVMSMVLYSFVMVVGLCGNTLVIYVVLRYSKMQTVTNTYILNLAIADELFLLGVPLLLGTVAIGYWPFGNVMCKVYMTVTSINQFSSSIFLAVMSTDRYVAVCHPISSPRYRTLFISKVVCVTGWTASALMMVPIFIYANEHHSPCGITCNIIWPGSENINGQTAFTLYSFVLGFAIPLVLIFVFYSLVIHKLQRVGPSNKSKEKKKSHRKVTKMVLAVITVYILCWLPYWIGQLTLVFLPPNQNQSGLILIYFLITGCFSYSNSAMNPILYAFLSNNFKKSFSKACQCFVGKEIKTHLHVENIIFPRGNRGSEKSRLRSEEQDSDDDNNDYEPSTAITMTSLNN